MDNQEAFLRELTEANKNILRLTLALENYTEKTDEKIRDYKDRFVDLDKDNEDFSERIRDLERKEDLRESREGYFLKILYGTLVSVLLMVAKSFWEIITKKN